MRLQQRLFLCARYKQLSVTFLSIHTVVRHTKPQLSQFLRSAPTVLVSDCTTCFPFHVHFLPEFPQPSQAQRVQRATAHRTTPHSTLFASRVVDGLSVSSSRYTSNEWRSVRSTLSTNALSAARSDTGTRCTQSATVHLPRCWPRRLRSASIALLLLSVI